MTASHSCSVMAVKDLSRRIPALLMSMVMLPNVSMAVLITAAPSATDEVLTTALPPAVGERNGLSPWVSNEIEHKTYIL